MNVGNARNFFFYNKLADRKISLKFFFWYIEAMQTQKMANKTSLVYIADNCELYITLISSTDSQILVDH